MTDYWTIPLAGLVAGIVGFLFGFPALRLTGLYLALATFAVAVAMPAIIRKFEGFTGGGAGINLFESPGLTGVGGTDPITFEEVPGGVEIWRFTIPTFNEWLYYLSWGVALVMFAVAWALLRGRVGRAFRAVRDSELAAASSGVNLARYKTLAFGVSAFFAGVSGSLLAIASTFVNPDTFPITLSIFLLVGVVVGGLGSLWPLVFGAIFIQFLPLWAQTLNDPLPDSILWIDVPELPRSRRARSRLRRRPDPDHAAVPGRRGRALPPDRRLLAARLPARRLVSRALPAAGAALVAALVVGLPGALARPAAEPGITPTGILLGGTASLSGPLAASAAVARGSDAYFRWVNARGGVHGRRIVYRYLDDASDAAQATQAARQLVEEDGVFALVSSTGTEQALAARGYLNGAGVPQLFVASGASALGRDYRRYPWTIGFGPSHDAEGRIYGAYLARTRPRARIAVLAQDDADGRELLAALRRGLGRSRARVVAVQSVEPVASDVAAQVATLQASGADVLAVFASARETGQAFAAAARLAWRPLALVGSASIATPRVPQGAVSLAHLKDAADPRWADDAGARLYRSIMTRYAKGRNARDLLHAHGMAVAYTARAGASGSWAGAHPGRRARRRAKSPRLLEPVPAAGDRGADEPSGSVPGRAGGVAATERPVLAALRGPLGRKLTCHEAHCAARRAARGPARGST